MSDSELRYPKCQDPRVEAVMELDPTRLIELVNVAETATHARLQELKTSPDGAQERLAIEDAMKTLDKIKKDRLKLA